MSIGEPAVEILFRKNDVTPYHYFLCVVQLSTDVWAVEVTAVEIDSTLKVDIIFDAKYFTINRSGKLQDSLRVFQPRQ